MPMTITDQHVRKTCRIGEGAKTCAFLMMSGKGWECAKGTGAERIIRDRLAEGSMGAKGDNCHGWIPIMSVLN